MMMIYTLSHTHTHTYKATNYAVNRAKESPHISSHGTIHINADITTHTQGYSRCKQDKTEIYRCDRETMVIHNTQWRTKMINYK